MTRFFFVLVTLPGIILHLAAGNPLDSQVQHRVKRKSSCGETVELTPGKPYKISSKKGECHWELLGTKKCQPEIVCDSVDIKKSEDCADEFLAISDGVGGEARICGDGKFTKPKIASKKTRDIFVDSDLSGSKGFTCTAQCGKGSGEVLPANGLPKKEEFKCVCGLQNKDDRIVGGEDAKMNEFPWQVALVRPGTRQPMCGGSVINNRYILTAAHCFWFAQLEPSDVEVLIHAHLLDFTVTREDASKDIKLGEAGSMQARGYDMAMKTDAEEGTQRYKVVEIINHALFTEGYDYDAALLKLDRKINLAAEDAPTPICLPKAGNMDPWEGKKPTVSGWGLGDENAGATTRLLQKLEVPVIPFKQCEDMMPHELSDRMLCAGFKEGKQDACTGDSGGPLYFKQDNKQWLQIGIVSWGEGCAQVDRPGMYSRVTEFTQWIQHHANKPGVVWCREDK